MPKLKNKQPQLKMNFVHILRSSMDYIRYNKKFCCCIFVINMVFMLTFRIIPSGISNPLSLIWVIGYYIFWSFFYRYYYRLMPYIDVKKLIGSLSPSAKAVILMAFVAVAIIFLPMIPLFLGYKNLYLDFYEQYLVLTVSNGWRSFAYQLVLYGLFTLLMPTLFCKPYLAWIASLRGRNASFSKVGDRTRGNYIQFVILSALLIFPELLAEHLDNMWQAQGWISYPIGTLLFMITNVIFAKIYDFFYIEN